MRGARIVIVDEEGGGSALYFVTSGREAWRVYDCVGEKAGRKDSVTPPDGIATHRVFVSQSGARRAYPFGPKDNRALVPRLLMVQLTAAKPVLAPRGT